MQTQLRSAGLNNLLTSFIALGVRLSCIIDMRGPRAALLLCLLLVFQVLPHQVLDDRRTE